MRCQQCEYRLWNLTSRQCPECGTPFAPSEFDFAPNTVRFCCPHCDQDYYGTSASGHLVPDAFDCVRCHNFIRMDEMVMRPAEGVDEEDTRAEVLPWLERARLGFFKAWWGTIKLALFQPSRVMRLAPVNEASGAAWWFAFLNTFAIMFLATLPSLIFMLIFSGGMGGGPPVPMTFFGVGMICAFVGYTVLLLLMIVIWGLVTHLVLALTGGTQHSMGRTFQCLCFSTGANWISAIPCVGPYLGWIWWLVSAIFMVMEGQRIGGGRATLGVLAIPLLMLIVGLGGTLYLFNQAMNATTITGKGFGTPVAETESIADAVLRYAEVNAYLGPDHALRLVTEDYLSPIDLVMMISDTQVADIPVNRITLSDWEDLTAPQQLAETRTAAGNLPAGVIAHRLGDFVFTYHGAVLNQCDLKLWIVIGAPDPDSDQWSNLANNPCDDHHGRTCGRNSPAILVYANARRTGLPEPTSRPREASPATRPVHGHPWETGRRALKKRRLLSVNPQTERRREISHLACTFLFGAFKSWNHAFQDGVKTLEYVFTRSARLTQRRFEPSSIGQRYTVLFALAPVVDVQQQAVSRR
jgi:endogenous inhibitor of DNA gyrase (YacG/DUF329 family)